MPNTTEVEATLNINAIGARTDFAGAAVADLSAEEFRYDEVVFAEGILQPADAFQVVAGGGSTMDVIVGSGAAKVDYAYVSGNTVGQGNYLVRLDDVSKTITLSAPDASQQRIDEIWLVVLDDVYDSSTKALPIFAVREGDVGGTAPGPDAAWEAAFKLATVTVPGGSSDITEATITDERVDAKLTVPAIEATDGTFNGVDIASHSHTGASGEGAQIDANDLINLQDAANAANLDADTVDGSHAADFAPAAHVGAGGAAHADAVAGGADGFMTGADKAKLDGIESGATQDQSAAQILSSLKTVDGSGSGLDADLLDGEHASAFANASHTHDSRYYTESEANSIFVNESGDTMHGPLHFSVTGANTLIQMNNQWQILGTSVGNVNFATTAGTIWTSIGPAGIDLEQGGYIREVDAMRPGELWPHNNANGSLRWMGVGSDFAQAHTSSSQELKTEISEVDLEKSVFARLEPTWFRYSDGHPLRERFENWETFENPEMGRMGFIWEQVEEVAPQWALQSPDMEGDEAKSVAYEGMLPDFIGWGTAAIQQLLDRVSALEEQVDALEA